MVGIAVIRPGGADDEVPLPDVPLDRIRFVGNAASTGAKLALTNRACRAESDLLSRTIRYVELAGRPDFQNAFSQAILFPEK